MSREVAQWARQFTRATATRTPAIRPTDHWPGVTLDDAYAIQQATIAGRIEAGESPQAVKLGLTQQAEQDQWGIGQPTFGTLTGSMLLRPDEPFSVSRGWQPKVEAEIVVIFGAEVVDPPATVADLLPAIASVHAGIEILDSRFRSGGFHPIDAVADNQSALSGVWNREGIDPADIDLANETVELIIDGDVCHSGHSSRILGNPLNALWLAVSELLHRGQPVFPGLAVFSGNLCPSAAAVSPGQIVEARFQSLGSQRIAIAA